MAGCGEERAVDVFSCAQCAGEHRDSLVDGQEAACDNDRISRWEGIQTVVCKKGASLA